MPACCVRFIEDMICFPHRQRPSHHRAYDCSLRNVIKKNSRVPIPVIAFAAVSNSWYNHSCWLLLAHRFELESALQYACAENTIAALQTTKKQTSPSSIDEKMFWMCMQ